MIFNHSIKFLFVLRKCIAFSFFLCSIQTMAQTVIPGFYREPGLNPNRSYVNQSANEHIDPFTGGLQRHYVDLYLPGNGGFDLKVIRSYNSTSVRTGSVDPGDDNISGVGWTMHFGRILDPGVTNASGQTVNICNQPSRDNEGGLKAKPVNLLMEYPDGSRETLACNDDDAGKVARWGPKRWKAVCGTTGVSTDRFVVFSPDGVSYEMTRQYAKRWFGESNPIFLGWFTTKITDRNGNYANITYGNNTNLPEIQNIITNDGRRIDYDYYNSGQTTRRLKSITSSGQTYQYVYESINGSSNTTFLTGVIRPDGTQWNYAYHGSSNSNYGSYRLKGVSTPQGGLIDYQYSGMVAEIDRWGDTVSGASVVTSKTTSDGGVWAFTYPTRKIGELDETIVDSPSGRTIYWYIGPNYADTGNLWTIGLLVGKVISDVQRESYTWKKQEISRQRITRGTGNYTKFDNSIYAPLLEVKEIIRNEASYRTTYSNFDVYGNAKIINEAGINDGLRTTHLTYSTDSTNWIINQVKDERYTGSNITREFFPNGNLKKITRDGVTTSYTYDGQGNIATVTLPGGSIHGYSNYKRGIAQSEIQPEGVTISRIVSDAGNVTSETNGDGFTTSYDYDALNRIKFIGYPVGNSVTISYSQVQKIAQRGALREVTDYDNFGRVIGITLGDITRSYEVDPLGRKTFESNPGSNSGTRFWYDRRIQARSARRLIEL